jgi:hypothetical protein
MTIEKLPWAVTPAVHSYQRFPAFEEWDALTKEYRVDRHRERGDV